MLSAVSDAKPSLPVVSGSQRPPCGRMAVLPRQPLQPRQPVHGVCLIFPHISACGCKPPQTAGRSGELKIRQRACSSSCAQRTPAGLPAGMSGMGWRWTGDAAGAAAVAAGQRRAHRPPSSRACSAWAVWPMGARRIRSKQRSMRGVQVDQRAADAVALGFQRQQVDRADFQRRAQHQQHIGRQRVCVSARQSGAPPRRTAPRPA